MRFPGSKYSKNAFAAGPAPDPAGELTALPRPLAGFRAEGKGGKGTGEKRRGGAPETVYSR